MDVVNFSEGILGIDKSVAPVVANCLRAVARDEPATSVQSLLMISVARRLDLGDRIEVPVLRQIGEKPLADTQKLFLSL